MQISRSTKYSIILTFIFLFIGYFVRVTSIYFFWEAKSIGWFIFFVALILLLLDNIRSRRIAAKKTWPPKIFIGLSALILVVKLIFLFVVPNMASYDQAVAAIRQNAGISSEVGRVKSVVLQLQGSVSSQSNGAQSNESGEFFFTVKGDRKFMDVEVYVNKSNDADWQVEIR